MGIVVFLITCWLVAYWIAGGWPRARRHLTGLTRSPGPSAAVGSAPSCPPPAGLACIDGPVAPPPQASPTLADLEFPAPAPEEPSMEGRLVAALLSGAVSPEHYHKAMHVLAARDERAHPMPPVPI